MFDQARDAGFNIVRLFGHGEETSFMLQTAPGRYDEKIFKGLDYIIAVAGSRGVRVLFVPINMWLSPHVGDGFPAYVEWAGLPVSESDQFWSNGAIKGMVKNHFSTLLNRKNAFSGVAWKDDPAIFGFDLFNEPRCPFGQDKAGCPKLVTAWVTEMADYVKVKRGKGGGRVSGRSFGRSPPLLDLSVGVVGHTHVRRVAKRTPRTEEEAGCFGCWWSGRSLFLLGPSSIPPPFPFPRWPHTRLTHARNHYNANPPTLFPPPLFSPP